MKLEIDIDNNLSQRLQEIAARMKVPVDEVISNAIQNGLDSVDIVSSSVNHWTTELAAWSRTVDSLPQETPDSFRRESLYKE